MRVFTFGGNRKKGESKKLVSVFPKHDTKNLNRIQRIYWLRRYIHQKNNL